MRATMLVSISMLGLAVVGTALAEDLAPPSPPPTVLIELYTSQGCSSCPPADRLLAELARQGEQEGIVLVPLSFHVDYWNYIGWRDPFSSADWSSRQRRYARAFDLDTIYTPQLFLNGRTEVVGSDEREVRQAIQRTAASPVARLELEIVSTSPSGGVLAVRVAAHPLQGFPRRLLEAHLALVQDGLVTPVQRGENARRTLHNERVVRSLETAFTLDGSGSVERRLTVELDPEWPRQDLSLVVFLQDPESMHVYGATSLPVDSAD